MNWALFESIKILTPECIIKSGSVYLFKMPGKIYCVSFKKTKDDVVIIDLGVAIQEPGKKLDYSDFTFERIKGGKENVSTLLWSHVITAVSEYIKEHKPNTLKIICSEPDLIKFYEYTFNYIKRFPAFSPYCIVSKELPEGTIYTISRKLSELTELDETVIKWLND